jgi:GH24 family phage-related lysozyme (muramidase)
MLALLLLANALAALAAPCAHLNPLGMDLIKEFEGFVAAPSPDPIGHPTVGYGHACAAPSCHDVPFAFPLSKRAASMLLKANMPAVTWCLGEALAPATAQPLNDNQWAALASWAFNEGCDAVSSSRLIARLNKGEDPEAVAADELPKWTTANGAELPGLRRRRAAELALFRTASARQAFPQCLQ